MGDPVVGVDSERHAVSGGECREQQFRKSAVRFVGRDGEQKFIALDLREEIASLDRNDVVSGSHRSVQKPGESIQFIAAVVLPVRDEMLECLVFISERGGGIRRPASPGENVRRGGGPAVGEIPHGEELLRVGEIKAAFVVRGSRLGRSVERRQIIVTPECGGKNRPVRNLVPPVVVGYDGDFRFAPPAGLPRFVDGADAAEIAAGPEVVDDAAGFIGAEEFGPGAVLPEKFHLITFHSDVVGRILPAQQQCVVVENQSRERSYRIGRRGIFSRAAFDGQHETIRRVDREGEQEVVVCKGFPDGKFRPGLEEIFPLNGDRSPESGCVVCENVLARRLIVEIDADAEVDIPEESEIVQQRFGNIRRRDRELILRECEHDGVGVDFRGGLDPPARDGHSGESRIRVEFQCAARRKRDVVDRGTVVRAKDSAVVDGGEIRNGTGF